MGKACSTIKEKRNACRFLVGKSEGERPLWRPKRRWMYIIKINFREMRLGGMDWVNLAQDRG
jgi:hypothetical protein